MAAIRILLLSVALVLSLAASPGAQAPSDPTAAIRQLLDGTFGKPDAPLSLDPIVVDGDAAIAGWIQGDLAGRAFLRQTRGRWAIVACGGDSLKAAATLQRLGLPEGQASRLAILLSEAEARADPRRVARFASFGDIVEMDNHAHPPAQRH